MEESDDEDVDGHAEFDEAADPVGPKKRLVAPPAPASSSRPRRGLSSLIEELHRDMIARFEHLETKIAGLETKIDGLETRIDALASSENPARSPPGFHTPPQE